MAEPGKVIVEAWNQVRQWRKHETSRSNGGRRLREEEARFKKAMAEEAGKKTHQRRWRKNKQGRGRSSLHGRGSTVELWRKKKKGRRH